MVAGIHSASGLKADLILQAIKKRKKKKRKKKERQ